MKQKAKASTQQHLDIEDIIDDLVILKTGWVALVMSTTAVNFDLLSEAEQDATIYAFGAFLNSLSFPLEILIRSKKADITSYFQSLEEAEAAQANPDLKRQIQKYKDFIQSTVQQKTVLDKKFYFIINFSPLEMGFKGLGGKKQTTPKSKAQLVADAKTALSPKRDHIIKQTSRLGLTTKQLTTQELIELFYDIYNPAPTGTQRILLDTEAYTTPLVQPAVEVPTPAPATFDVAPPPSPETSQNLPPSPPSPGLDLRPVPQPDPPQPAPLPETSTQPQPLQTLTPQPELRPVANPTPPGEGLAPHQADALKNLQGVTARAAQITNGPQSNNPIAQQPSNLKP